MSSNHEQKNGITDDAHAASHSHSPSAPSGGGPYILLFFILGLALSMVVGWAVFPQLLYSHKDQPFDFSHKIHMEQVDGCQSCHYFREDGTFAGVPRLEQCIDCHEEVMG